MEWYSAVTDSRGGINIMLTRHGVEVNVHCLSCWPLMTCFFTVRNYLLHAQYQSWRSKSEKIWISSILVPSQLPAMSGHPQPENCPWSTWTWKDKPLGSLFYPTTTAYRLPLLLCRACRRSVERATICEPTGSSNRQFPGKIMAQDLYSLYRY